MKKFNTLLDAAKMASTLYTGWRFAYSDEEYDIEGLLDIASVHDSENPIDEDSFYVVSLGGAIGLCQDSDDIDWLFIQTPDTKENLPGTYSQPTGAKFCFNCGKPVSPGANFCMSCGTRLA